MAPSTRPLCPSAGKAKYCYILDRFSLSERAEHAKSTTDRSGLMLALKELHLSVDRHWGDVIQQLVDDTDPARPSELYRVVDICGTLYASYEHDRHRALLALLLHRTMTAEQYDNEKLRLCDEVCPPLPFFL